MVACAAMRTLSLLLTATAALSYAGAARADDAPTGAPPPDATALVSAPKASSDAPKIEAPTDQTTVTLSAGGQYNEGNSKSLAGTVNGAITLRRGANGFGAAILGNYAESVVNPQDANSHYTESTHNVQGRLRYDRYLLERLSVFLIGTGRYDRFQGLDLRLNIDPGVKYLVVMTPATTVWGELGYDFQYDVNSLEAIHEAAAATPATSVPRTDTDHSIRAFVGLKHAFNKEVNLSTGLEYLQSLKDVANARLNYELIFAANVGGGFSVGLGFTERWEYNPLPTKKNSDSSLTASLISAFDAAPAAAPPAPPPACAPAPEPPPPPPSNSTVPAPPPPSDAAPATTGVPAAPATTGTPAPPPATTGVPAPPPGGP